MPGALSGLRVIEIGQEIQGPFASLFLSDLGAEVIKIEKLQDGDLARRTTVGRIAGPDAPNADFQQYFFVLNRGKKSLTLDLKKEEGRVVLKKLLASSDVLLTNFRPGVLDKLGLGYDDLKDEFPRLIYAVASSWGPEGPWARRPSRDLLAQAASGLMAKTGMDSTPPLPAGSILADYCGAHMAATGILAALYSREQTGRGQRVDTSMYGTLIALQPWEIAQTSLTGQENRKAQRGTQFLRGVWGAFKTKDGWLSLAGVDENRWSDFCQIIGRPDLEDDPEYDMEARNFHGAKVQALLDEIFPSRTTAEWMEDFSKRDMFAAKVENYQDVLASEQAAINGYITEVDHPEIGSHKFVGHPIKMSASETKPITSAPELGAHTDELLEELGFDADDIEKMRSTGIV